MPRSSTLSLRLSQALARRLHRLADSLERESIGEPPVALDLRWYFDSSHLRPDDLQRKRLDRQSVALGFDQGPYSPDKYWLYPRGRYAWIADVSVDDVDRAMRAFMDPIESWADLASGLALIGIAPDAGAGVLQSVVPA